MIVGEVTSQREALISLTVIGNAGNSVTLEAVIDTGFTDYLTLPASVISDLDLFHIDVSWATLADGSVVTFDIFEGSVLWHGQQRPISVHSAEGGPLVGMSLLYGSVVTLEVLDGGSVTIEPE